MEKKVNIQWIRIKHRSNNKVNVLIYCDQTDCMFTRDEDVDFSGCMCPNALLTFRINDILCRSFETKPRPEDK